MSENTKSLKKTEGLVGAFSEEKKENITSLELVEQINLFREQEKGSGFTPLLHKSLLGIIRDEFEEEINEQKILPVTYKDKKGENRIMFSLTFNQAKQVLMRESKFVRKRMIVYIEHLEEVLKKVVFNREDILLLKVLKTETIEGRAVALNEYIQEIVKPLKEENKVMLPKAAFYDAVAGSESLVDMNQVAKTLNVKGLGRNNLFKFLREQNVLMENNQPYQQYMDAGYFKLIEVKWTDPKSEMINVSTKTMIFQRGVGFIDKLVKQKFNKTDNK